VQERVAHTAIRYCWGAAAPATPGVVLANEAAANRKGGVVVASRRLVVDHDGACGAAALSADHFPAVLGHPLHKNVTQRRKSRAIARANAHSRGPEPK
jgi:hypothetical protein